MASIRYSATGGEIKGKINGTVYQGGKSGPIVKRLLHRSFVRIASLILGVLSSTIIWAGSTADDGAHALDYLYADGSHKASGKVADQRSILSAMAASWKSLTVEQRAAWNAAAVNFPFKNKFGDQYTGSGFQVYQQLNMGLVLINGEANVFPPFPNIPTLPEITPPDGETDDPMLYTITGGVPAGQAILVYSSIGQSQGRQIQAKNMKLIGILAPGDTTGTINLRPQWPLFFGMLQPNTAVQFKFVPVSTTTGEMGTPETKVELIDALAAGAKLTKADAAHDFGAGPFGDPVTFEEPIIAYNVGTGVTATLSGTNAAEFELSFDDDNYGDPMTQAANQWGNIYGVSLFIRTNYTGAGAKSATVTFTASDNTVVGTILLTGNPV